LNRLIRCVCGKKIGPDPRNFNQRVSLGRNDLLIRTFPNRIGHLQIADNPNRGEPGTGEINYDYLFKFIDRSSYDGWVGCEYKPLTTTEAGLTWFNHYR
ncbi:TIM barrel protein, partial [Klebsiella michiganensis]|uniref:TIM barrel protein n=1 Tax=Klebsiella michiganensis TaxID=1134687 RepID=UPI002FF39BF3